MPSRQQVIDRLGLDDVEVLALGSLSSQSDRRHRIVSARLNDVVQGVATGTDLQVRAHAQFSAPVSLVRLRVGEHDRLVEALVPLVDGAGRDQVRWLVDGTAAEGPPDDVAAACEAALDRLDELADGDLAEAIRRMEQARLGRALVAATKQLRMSLRKALMDAVVVEAGLQRLRGRHDRATTLEALGQDWTGDHAQLLRTVAVLVDGDTRVSFPALVDRDHRALLCGLAALDGPDAGHADDLAAELAERVRVARASIDAAVAGLGVVDPVCLVDRGWVRVTSDEKTLARVAVARLLGKEDDRRAVGDDGELAGRVADALQTHTEEVVVLVLSDRARRLRAGTERLASHASRCRHLHQQLVAVGGVPQLA